MYSIKGKPLGKLWIWGDNVGSSFVNCTVLVSDADNGGGCERVGAGDICQVSISFLLILL